MPPPREDSAVPWCRTSLRPWPTSAGGAASAWRRCRSRTRPRQLTPSLRLGWHTCDEVWDGRGTVQALRGPVVPVCAPPGRRLRGGRGDILGGGLGYGPVS